MSNYEFKVTKRDGSTQEFKVSEIKKKLNELSVLIPEEIRIDMMNNIESSLSQYIKNNMKTSDIQRSLIDCLKDFIDIDIPYMEYVTSKAVFQQIYHEVYKNTGFRTYPSDINKYDDYDKESFVYYINYGVEKQLLAPNLITDYTQDDLKKLSEALDYSRDNNFKFIGIHTLYKRYLLKEGNKLIEVPQWRFMCIAMFIASNEKTNKDRVKYAIKYYDLLSQFIFMSATPTTNNGGKIRHQLSSCFIGSTFDSLEGIYDNLKEFAEYSKYGGGAGWDISRIRANNSSIRSHKNASKGVIPWIKGFNNTAVSVDQTGCVAKNSYVRILNSITLDGVEYKPDYVFESGKTALEISYEEINMEVKFNTEVRSIQDVNEGEYVFSFNDKLGKNEFNKILKVHDDIYIRREDQIKIYLHNKDQYIITSKWHPILCKYGDTYKYKRSDEVIIGDRVVSEFGFSKVLLIDTDPNIDSHYFDLTVDNVNNYFCITDKSDYNMHVVHNTRSGSIAISLQIHHADIILFLECRRNNTDDRKRAGDIFPSIYISDLFMKQLEKEGDWYLFDPHTSPELNESYGDEYETLYWKAVEDKKYVSIIKAKELWTEIIKNLFETGMPFIAFKDTINKSNRHPEDGYISSSNLCHEITLPVKPNSYKVRVYKTDSYEEYDYDSYVDKYKCKANDISINHDKDILYTEIITIPGETAVCNLASVNLLKYYNLPLDERRDTIHTIVRFLDSVIDKNLYITPQSRNGSLHTRAVGMGIMNEHGLIASRQIMYGSDKHKELLEELYKELAEFSDEGSKLLSNDGTRKNHYVRAIAPTGSISLITGCTQGIDPIFKRRWVEENKLGSDNPVLAPNLNIDTYNYYVNAYEIDLDDLVECNAIRQKYIDQAISFTLYIDPSKQYIDKVTGKVISPARKVSEAIKKAWKLGIKTTYYLRSKSPKMTKDSSSDGNLINCEGCQ